MQLQQRTLYMKSEFTLLKVPVEFGHSIDYIYPTIIFNQKEMLLVDCGYPDYMRKIMDEAKKQDIDMEKLSQIFITHHDYDHIGSLAEFQQKMPRVITLSSAKQKSYIEKQRKSLRLQQAEEFYHTIPEEQKEEAKYLQTLFASVEPAVVNCVVENGNRIDGFEDLVVIETSGHMPEHLSLYIEASKTLIAGDALVIEDGHLQIANPEFCLDLKEAKESVQKLREFEIEQVVCYHGGLFIGNVEHELQHIME